MRKLLPQQCLLVLLLLFTQTAAATSEPERNHNNNNNSPGEVLNFLTDFPSIPFNKSEAACRHNSDLLQAVLTHNASHHRVVFPANVTWHFFHGIVASHLHNAVLQIDGTIRFEKGDLTRDKRFLACLTIAHGRNITVTSSSRLPDQRGVIDGRGSQYWGIPIAGYVQREERRPRLLRFNLTEDLLIENIALQDSPYHTLYLDLVNRVEIRHVSIVARRTHADGHSWVDLTAFNTDGIDVSGHNVWVHDCDIWVQDDCIAVKDVKNHSSIVPYHPVSSNMTFERINATGLGFTIGSIAATHVRNITFRDSYLHKTVKGIYLKFVHPKQRQLQHNLTAIVEDILYDNITLQSPTQWPIWMGPAQQADTKEFCNPNPCSLCWPLVPGSQCHTVSASKFRNITLRNISIRNPQMSPGVLYGSPTDTIDNVTFDNVIVDTSPESRQVPISDDLCETFPGLRLPLHDAHVPPILARVQRWVQRFMAVLQRWFAKAKNAVERTRGRYTTTAIYFVQNGGGAEQWYLSVVLQAVLGAVWVWLLLALIWGILALCILRHWTRTARRQRQARIATSDHVQVTSSTPTTLPPKACLYHALYATLFGVFFLAAIACLILPFRKFQWQRTNQYYQCRGVKNGTAKGKTWPVPYCFQHEHEYHYLDPDDDNHGKPEDDEEDDDTSATTSVLDTTILLLCLSLVTVMVVFRTTRSSNEESSIGETGQHRDEHGEAGVDVDGPRRSAQHAEDSSMREPLLPSDNEVSLP